MSRKPVRETIGRPLAEAPDPLHLDAAPLAPPPDEAPAPLALTDPEPGPEAGESHSLTPYIDAHGFDPAEYRWVPVRRKPRKDGWSEYKQRLFIETLADSGSVDVAAHRVNMSIQSAYALRRAPGAEPFAAAWNAAIQQAALKLVDLAFDRAVNGSDEPVFNKEGYRVGRRMKPSDTMLKFLLRAYMPERFRYAHRDTRLPAEPPPLDHQPPVAHALEGLAPVTPPEPHKLVEPERFDTDIQLADMCDGELPHWYRRQIEPEPRYDPARDPLRLPEETERELEWAKHGISPPPHDGWPGDEPLRGGDEA